MPDDPIEECWSEIRPPREPDPKEVETQVITFDISGLNVKDKSELCMRIAWKLLRSPNWTLVEDQAINFMTMTDKAVLETAKRVGIQLVVAQPTSRSRELELIDELNAKLHY